MYKRMNWEQLLCKKRQRTSGSASGSRNDFEADYDRIVGSSSVRRLQDKAQVFPLQENDFTRTRLTHSIEVAAMAFSMGKYVGKELESRGEFGRIQTEELAALLRVAGLIHDLGNPPFGHYGETVIRNWFSHLFSNSEINNFNLTRQQENDFRYFDGNVQNIRIVTKLQTLNDAYGANFTYATLATIIKYPWSSDSEYIMNIEKEKKKKFGFFVSEQELVKQIWEETGLQEGVRHPATYLLEAADDITYICDDIEDGAKKGYINWKEEYINLKNKFPQGYEDLFKSIDVKNPDSEMVNSEKEASNVRNFRNFMQSYLILRAEQTFMDNYENIMEGRFNGELLDCEEKLVGHLKKITFDKCFTCQEVMALELVGDKVIKTLLDEFVPTICRESETDLEEPSTRAGKIYNLISPNFKYIATHDYANDKGKKLAEVSAYDKIHLVLDYISGMTDSFAVNLYKELSGIKLPGKG